MVRVTNSELLPPHYRSECDRFCVVRTSGQLSEPCTEGSVTRNSEFRNRIRDHQAFLGQNLPLEQGGAASLSNSPRSSVFTNIHKIIQVCEGKVDNNSDRVWERETAGNGRGRGR